MPQLLNILFEVSSDNKEQKMAGEILPRYIILQKFFTAS